MHKHVHVTSFRVSVLGEGQLVIPTATHDAVASNPNDLNK